MSKAIFLDRDWVLNKKAPEHEYVNSVQEFFWIPKAKDLIKFCNDSGRKVFVVTNQQGVWKWITKPHELQKIHDTIQKDLAKIWAKIDKFYVCPHLEVEDCECRKPKPGMILQAFKEFPEIEWEKCCLIGDSLTDINAGDSVGLKTLRIASDWLQKEYDKVMSFLQKQ